MGQIVNKDRLITIFLIVVQIIAITLYPLSFFRQYPQSAVLPPILLGIFILTLFGVFTKTIDPLTGRISMVFTLGINMVMRVVLLCPHIKNAQGEINGWFIFFTLLSIVLSWLTVVRVEENPIQPLGPSIKNV
jgi:hypothetical protein